MQTYKYTLDGISHTVQYNKSNIPTNFQITNKEHEICSTIKYLFNRWKEINPHIKWWMMGGSLLGTVRHQGMIPWDNDGDIGIMYSDYSNVKCGVFGDVIIEPAAAGYRVKKTNTTFPFIDVFIFDTDYKDPSKITLCSPIGYSKEKTYYASFLWNEFFYPDQLEELDVATFEGIQVPIPKNAGQSLHRLYGNDCETYLYYDSHVDAHSDADIMFFEKNGYIWHYIFTNMRLNDDKDYENHLTALILKVGAEFIVRSKIDLKKVHEIILEHSIRKLL